MFWKHFSEILFNPPHIIASTPLDQWLLQLSISVSGKGNCIKTTITTESMEDTHFVLGLIIEVQPRKRKDLWYKVVMETTPPICGTPPHSIPAISLFLSALLIWQLCLSTKDHWGNIYSTCTLLFRVIFFILVGGGRL